MTVIDFSLGTITLGYKTNGSHVAWKANTLSLNAKSILSYASDL